MKYFLSLFLIYMTVLQSAFAATAQVNDVVQSGGFDSGSNITVPANDVTTFSLTALGQSNGNFAPFIKNGALYQAPPYTFTVTSANATAAATYTNNGQTFVVLTTIAGGTTLSLGIAPQNAAIIAPTASGTLTKTSGSGDATITFSAVTSGKSVVVWSEAWNGGATAGGSWQFASSFTTFTFNAASITSGFYQTGQAGFEPFTTSTSGYLNNHASIPYTFYPGTFPGIQAANSDAKPIVTAKEFTPF